MLLCTIIILAVLFVLFRCSLRCGGLESKKEGMCCGASASPMMVTSRKGGCDLVAPRECPNMMLNKCKNYPYNIENPKVVGPGSGCGVSCNLACHRGKCGGLKS